MPRNLADSYLQKTTIEPVVNEVALVVKGKSGQTFSLQQWQNSTGAVVTSIDRFGTIYMDGPASFLQSSDSNSYLFYTPGTTGGINSELVADHAGSTPLVIKGAASQTADLQQWRNSAGTALARVNAVGSIQVPYVEDAAFTGPYLQMTSATVFVNNRTAVGNVPLVVKGMASQTADLQQWQNSAGGVVAAIYSNGGFGTPNIYTTNVQSYSTGAGPYLIVNGYAVTVAARAGGDGVANVPFIVSGMAGQTGDLQQWRNSAGTVLTSINSYGTPVTNMVSFPGGGNIRSAGAGTGMMIYESTAGGYAAQHMFADRDGVELVYMGVTPNGARGLQARTLWVGNVGTPSAVDVCVVIKGAAAQTSDLTQWKNSAGADLTRVDAAGSIITLATVPTYLGNTLALNDFYMVRYATQAVQMNGQVAVVSVNAGAVPFLVRGAASQSADLQQWQNSAGTVLANIQYTGSASFGPYLSAGASSIPGSAALFVNPTYNGTAGIIVKGAVGQSGDLQQWQNSGGTVLALVDAGGAFGIGAVPITATLNVGSASDNSFKVNWQGLTAVRHGSTGGPLLTVTQVGSSYSSASGAIEVNTDNPAGNANYLYKGKLNGSDVFTVRADGYVAANALTVASSAGSPLLSVTQVGSTYASASGAVEVNTENPAGSSNYLYKGKLNGTVVFAVRADGVAYLPTIRPTSGFGPYVDLNGGVVAVVNHNNVSNIPFMVYGMAGQTGDLQQWRNSADTVLAAVNNNGVVSVSGMASPTIDPSAFTGPRIMLDGSKVKIENRDNAAYIPLVVKGMTSQTGDLQQWQNSAGNVLTVVTSYGGMRFPNQSWLSYSNGSNYLRSGADDALPIICQAGSPTQTASLQEWRLSNDSPVAKVDAGGGFFVQNIQSPATTGSYLQPEAASMAVYGRSNAANIVFTVRGMASQTGDLQQWQNSVGTTVAAVTPAGYFWTLPGILMGDGSAITFTTTNGAKIGGGATEKLSFWGATPVVQPAGIADADGTLGDVTTKFNALIAKLETMGLLATV